jgi:hypothetical protein
MAFKGQIMHDVPVVCLWCIWGACNACGGACGFSGYTFFCFPISLTTYLHFKALSNISYASEWPLKVVWCFYRSCMMCLWCACGAFDVPLMPVVVPVGFLDCLFFVFPFHWLHSNIKKSKNHSYVSEWPSKVVWCDFRSCLMCLWCASGG